MGESDLYVATKVLSLLAFIFLFTLSSCGGGGGGGGSPSTPASSPSKFFVVDSANSAIASVANSNPAPGSMTVNRIIAGSNTGLMGAYMHGLAYDAMNNRLYVVNNGSILVFNNANTAAGNVAPARAIGTGQQIYAMFLDTANDILYVAVYGNGAVGGDKILAYNNASTANGSLIPNRSVSITLNSGTFQIRDISVDTSRNILYVAGFGGTPTYSPRVLAYENALTLNGTNITASRAIAFIPNVHLGGIALDQTNNRLYVACGDKTVKVIDNVSTTDGSISPTRTIYFGSSTEYIYPDNVLIDTTNDRLYAIAANGVYILNGASTANGTVSSTFAIAPSGSSLRAATVTP